MLKDSSDRVGVWAFLVSIAFIPTIMSSAILGRWAVIAMGVPLVAPLRWDIPQWLKVSIVVGLSWAAASVFISPDRLDSLLQLFFLVLLLGVVGAASQQPSLESAMGAMCWGVGVSVILCFLGIDGDPVVAQGTTGYAGLFYNCEVLCEFAAPLAVWAMVQQRWTLVAICITPILMNNSRISYAMVIVGAVLAFWPRAWRWRVAILTIAAAGGGGLLFFMTLADRFGSAVYRVLIWLVAAMAITPAGHGIGWYRITHPMEEFAHSDVIQAFAELGIGALFFAPIVLVGLRNTEDRAEHAAFVVICIELVVSFPLHVPGAAFMAALLAGYLVRNRRVVRGVRPDGGIDFGQDNEWPGAGRLGAARARGPRHFGIPVRCEAAALPVVGLSRDGAQGAG